MRRSQTPARSYSANERRLGRFNRHPWKRSRGGLMKSLSIAIVAGFASAVATGTAMAHHSFAMFDTTHPKEIVGTVKEFRFVSPHTILIVQVKDENGEVADWVLEGGAPGLLVRAGMTS